MIYASAITDGVHNLMTMESAPAGQRARQATAKLRQVPRLLASARANLQNPPRVFVERALVMWRGAADLLARELPAAFANIDDADAKSALTAAADAARTEIERYVSELERDVLPQATGRYAIGTAAVEARYRAEELIDAPAATLLAIGERELTKAQADFEATAARVDPAHPGRPAIDVWRGVLADHPKRGELVAAAQRTVEELFTFISERRLVDVPEGERPIVAAALPFDLGLASMHSSPPLEPTSGEELLLHYRRAGGLAGRAAGCLAAEVQLRHPRRHLGARSGARPLRPQPVHAAHTWEDPADLDWAESVSAALVWPGRVGPLRRAVDERRGIQTRRSALPAGADQRVADPHLPADRRPATAQRRVDDRSGGAAVRARGALAGARGAAGSGARHLRSHLRRVLPGQNGGARFAARLRGVAWRSVFSARLSRARDD